MTERPAPDRLASVRSLQVDVNIGQLESYRLHLQHGRECNARWNLAIEIDAFQPAQSPAHVAGRSGSAAQPCPCRVIKSNADVRWWYR